MKPSTFSLRFVSSLAAALGVATLASFASSAHAQLLTSVASDATVFFTNPTNPTDGGGTVQDLTGNLQSGRDGSNYLNAVFVFQLPSLGAVTNPFTDSSFTLTIPSTGSIDSYNNGLNRDLYGLRSRANPAVLGADFYLGNGDGSAADGTDATLLQAGFITGDNTARFSNDVSKTTTGQNLTDYLNSQYADGAGAGNYVFLRLNTNIVKDSFTALPIYSADSTTNPAFLPQINYTAAAVPEPSACAVAFAGLTTAAIVAGRRRLVVRA